MRRNLRPPDNAAPSSGAAFFILYSRQSCHLCDDMLQMLQAHGLEPKVVDVDTDSVLRERYGAAVPVLCDGDIEVCRYHLDMALLQAHLSTLN